MSNQALMAAVVFVALVATIPFAYSLRRRAWARGRLWQDEPNAEPERHAGRIGRWLALAGHRDPGAPFIFFAACIACVGTGVAMALTLGQSPLLLNAAYEVAAIPVVGPPLTRGVLALPWLGALFMTVLPLFIVRAQRERRIAAIEQDLPMLLELLATLAESGLGFDASLDRVVESHSNDRPLLVELRLYALEVRAGGGRAACLERLARRLEVPSVTSAVSALMQAEEMGSGLADVLRPLADDLRQRRRERALARAEALPEKLVFPLVLGFLPGLMVWTLGPSLHQLITTIDAIMGGAP